MTDKPKQTHLQIDHPEIDDLHQDYKAESIEAHVLSLIHRWPYEQLKVEAQDKNVLELGCNKGLGTIIYAECAKSVKAVDTSIEAIEKAKQSNSSENIEYVCLDSWTLPFEDDSFDLTVVFQVIEHIALDKLEIFLNEIKRVTCSDGQVIFTTPNRKIRLLPFQKPWNKFHTKEYSAEDLRSLLGRYFLAVKVEALFGTKPLNEIERNRVRQKPAKVYLKKPLKGYVVNPIRSFFAKIFGSKKSNKNPVPIGTRKHNKKPINVNPEPIHYPFTVDDLEIREDSLNEGLDLRASILRVK